MRTIAAALRARPWLVAWAALAVAALGITAVAFAVDDDDRPGAAASTSTSSAATSSSTTVASTSTAPPTTTWRCPPLPARHKPDPLRPRYTVRVDADPGTGVVDGDLTVRFTPDGPIDRLVFRLWPNGPRPAAAGSHLDVGEVTTAGRALETRRPDPTTLEVLLRAPRPAGRTIEVSMPWRLEVPGSVPDRVSRSGDSLRLGSFLPLLAWQPGVGWAREPPTSAFAESTTSPTADWSVAITVPRGYRVLASGAKVGDRRWVGDALRDFAISVGRFELATATANAPQPVAVTVGAHAGTGEDPHAYLARVVSALEDFGVRYGAYPWPTYTLAITPGLAGGIEFPAHVMQGPGSIGRTTPHEVAHMWFYGLVGNNQGRDPWLDEGIASYAEARHEGTIDSFRSRSIPSVGAGRAGEPMTYWESHQSAYYRSVYVQGAVAMAALGPLDRVDCALRHYVARNAHRIARPGDLLAAAELVFPRAAARLAPYGLP